MWKKILLSLGTVMTVGGAATVGTYALLNDSVTLTANSFSTGSVDLQIWDFPTSTYGETTVGFNDTMLPGGTSGPHVFWLKNNDSGAGLAITGVATITDFGSGDYDPTDLMITMQAVTPDGSGNVGAPVTQSLAAWTSPTAFGPNIPDNGEQRYHMTVTLDSGVTTSAATVSFDFTFTGTQI